MRAQVVVPGADGGEFVVEIVGHARIFEPVEDLAFQCPEQALEASVLPRADSI